MATAVDILKIGNKEYSFLDNTKVATADISTTQSRNLIPFPYEGTSPQTHNGVTWTDNPDGTVTINGKASASSYHGIFGNKSNLMGLEVGKKYTLTLEVVNGTAGIYLSNRSASGTNTDLVLLSAVKNGRRSATFTYTQNSTFVRDWMQLYVSASYAENVNAIARFWIEEGTIAREYENPSESNVNLKKQLDEKYPKTGGKLTGAVTVESRNMTSVYSSDAIAFAPTQDEIYKMTFPSKGGTLALLSDIPTIPSIPVNNYVSSFNGTEVNVPKSTGTSILSFDIQPGTYLILTAIRVRRGVQGANRRIQVGLTEGAVTGATVQTVDFQSTEFNYTFQNLLFTYTTSAARTLYVNAYQTSDDTLEFYSVVRVIRLV